MSRNAQRRSLDFCIETCPAVETALDNFIIDNEEYLPPRIVEALRHDLIEAFKREGTIKLRSGLVEACEELASAESKAQELQDRIDTHEVTIEDMRSQIRDLERQLEDAEVPA